eukprot:13701595-Alexandrium_andersonii.AAC.1
MSASLVGSEMCIRDRLSPSSTAWGSSGRPWAIGRHGAKHALKAAWSVEIDKDLAEAVEGWRKRDRRLTEKFPVVRAADDVRGLF